jgi:hypothetical protein
VPASKRMRLDEQGAAAAAAGAGIQQQRQGGLQQPAAGLTATEQQPLQQQSVPQHQPPPQQSALRPSTVNFAPAPADIGSQDLLLSAMSEHIRTLQLWQCTLRLRQPGRLWPAGNACYGSASVARVCERALVEAFAGSSDWDVDVVVNHLFGGECVDVVALCLTVKGSGCLQSVTSGDWGAHVADVVVNHLLWGCQSPAWG